MRAERASVPAARSGRAHAQAKRRPVPAGPGAAARVRALHRANDLSPTVARLGLRETRAPARQCVGARKPYRRPAALLAEGEYPLRSVRYEAVIRRHSRCRRESSLKTLGKLGPPGMSGAPAPADGPLGLDRESETPRGIANPHPAVSRFPSWPWLRMPQIYPLDSPLDSTAGRSLTSANRRFFP